MYKKLTKHGNSLALIIDKPILELLNITSDSKLELTIEDGTLIIRSSKSKPTRKELSKKERIALVEKVADEVMDTYHKAFKKLAQ